MANDPKKQEDKTTNRKADDCVDTPFARRAEAKTDKHDHLKDKDRAESRQEALLDEGVEETFPASDPVSAKRIT